MLTDADRMLDAARIGDVDTLRALITGGVDVNVRHPFGSPLLEAARFKAVRLADSSHSVQEERHTAAIEFLLENGADPNTVDHRGKTPLHAAALKADKFLVRRLLDAGADPNAKEKSNALGGGFSAGDTPLHSACELERKNNAACVQMLIQAGARVDEYNDMRQTPLFISMLRRDGSLVKLLLRAGADIDMARQGRKGELRQWSRANLDLIAAVEKAGGWPAYVLAHRRVVVGLVTKCAPLPTDAAAHVASFLWPEGGF